MTVRRMALVLGWCVGLIGGGLVGPTGPADASEWCGENGLIRLVFATAEGPTAVHEATVGDDGTTHVELYAYLDAVAPVQREEEALVAIGGFELTLQIEGGEAFIVEEKFPFKVINVGRRPGECIAGIDPGQKLLPEGTELVRWTVVFAGQPRNVAFRLDPSGSVTCGKLPACAESGSYAVYVGSVGSGQVSDVFGAGYTPAYLNWEGEPDPAPLTGRVSWQEVGRYGPRD